MTHPDRNAEVDFRGERRSNATHASTTDPEARLYKESPEAGAMLCFMGHTLMENRSGLIVQADLTRADGQAERRDRHDPPPLAGLDPPPDPRGRQGLRQRRLRH
jgi:hypothetical protein